MPARGDSAPPGGDLRQYRAKRSPDRSPEPVGTLGGEPGWLFVVHKHAARQLHYDLRLEMDGVLRSWAVPRGPSCDTNDKRLAVRVEDHPLEYGDFEGVIPQGNYGAGAVIVWDRGEWVPLEDWRTGLEKGKLLFELRGYKLRGRWTLVKIKKSERDWLLIKERDGWVRTPGDEFPPESVLSGVTVEELKAGKDPVASLRRGLAGTEAPRVRVDPRSVKLMLAETADDAFTRDGWLFELKLDGYRLLACKIAGEALLLTRNGHDYTRVFPEIARAVKALPVDSIILDGEVIVADAQGLPSFARLQQRGRLKSEVDIRHAAVELPATYYAFDLIAFEDFDLRPLPLEQRKRFLLEAVPTLGPVRALDHVARVGEAFLEQVSAMGLEGIIAKKAAARYRGGRTDSWLKIKAERAGDFVIVGFTEPKGSRSHFGALQVAAMVKGRLAYAGRVGTGFDERRLAELGALLGDLVRREPPCEGPVLARDADPLPAGSIPDTRTTTWVEPLLVCEIQFREWTPDGLLRHPVFRRLRDDKRPEECEREWTGGLQDEQLEPAPIDTKPTPTAGQAARTAREAAVQPATENAVQSQPHDADAAGGNRTIQFSNLQKVYWPDERYTKGDLIEYYRSVSRWLLPYLQHRPLVMTRFPDGIDGKSFYQKDAPEFAPQWLRTVPIWSEDSQRDIRYFVCDDEESLLYVANLGSIPLHLWASRVGSLGQPDWCVIDLDPKEAPFSDVVRCAQALRELCERIGLPSYVKTTGKTGLHILLPLGQQCTYDQSRTLGELLARVVLRELGEIATITRHVSKRGDKVYLDYLQNRHGQTIVAPFSVRPLPGATVSMPLRWEEVNEKLDPRHYTIRSALERMEQLGSDPMVTVLEEKPALDRVLQRLTAIVSTTA